jgi:hypothetical protein
MRGSLALVMFVAAGCASAPGPSGTSRSPGGNIVGSLPTADELRRDLTVFASDSFGGRETGTADAARAAAYLVSRVSAIGLEPAGDSGFYQRVPLMVRELSPSTRLEVITPTQTKVLTAGQQIGPLLSLGPGAPPPHTVVEGDVVFAGYGITDPALGRDDLANLSFAGKVVVVVNGAPANADSARRKELEGSSQIAIRLQRLLPQRPAAIVILLGAESTDLFDELRTELMRQMSLRDTMPEVPDSQRVLPMILIGVAQIGSPLLPDGWPLDDKPQVLTGHRFRGKMDIQRRSLVAHNVVAVMRGSDPSLRASYVAFGAHYDHIGRVSPPVNGDSIANGADDDGSGSMALLAIARAMHDGPRPRRSILFVWHVGEEKGLLGSQYFTTSPTVPIDSIVAQLNADMIGRNGRDSLYIVGPLAAPNGQSAVLGTIVDSVNAAQPQPFVFNREWDSPSHPEQIYFRSDHFSYARRGIPIVFFTTGLHPDYHKVTDEVSKINFDKLAHVAALMTEVGRAVGNRTERPIKKG